MTDLPRPDKPYVCIECGELFDSTEALHEHWRVNMHGPQDTQVSSLRRARFRLTGEGTDDGQDVQ